MRYYQPPRHSAAFVHAERLSTFSTFARAARATTPRHALTALSITQKVSSRSGIDAFELSAAIC